MSFSFEENMEYFRKAEETFTKVLGPEHPFVLDVHISQAQALIAQKDTASAAKLCQSVLQHHPLPRLRVKAEQLLKKIQAGP